MKLELKHLAPYLPYELKMKTKYGLTTMDTLNSDGINIDHEESYYFNEDNFKPILRPLSDLKSSGIDFGEYNNEYIQEFNQDIIFGTCSFNDMIVLLKNHFDVFGLIENNLAIDINTLKT